MEKNFDTSALDEAGLVPMERPDSTEAIVKSGDPVALQALDDKYRVDQSEQVPASPARGFTKEMENASSLKNLRDIVTYFDAPKTYLDQDAGEISAESLRDAVVALSEAQDFGTLSTDTIQKKVQNLSPKGQAIVVGVLRKEGIVQ